MNVTSQAPLSLSEDEAALLSELLESAQAKLLIEIRHTAHRNYKDELRRRLELVEKLLERSRRN